MCNVCSTSYSRSTLPGTTASNAHVVLTPKSVTALSVSLLAARSVRFAGVAMKLLFFFHVYANHTAAASRVPIVGASRWMMKWKLARSIEFPMNVKIATTYSSYRGNSLSHQGECLAAKHHWRPGSSKCR